MTGGERGKHDHVGRIEKVAAGGKSGKSRSLGFVPFDYAQGKRDDTCRRC